MAFFKTKLGLVILSSLVLICLGLLVKLPTVVEKDTYVTTGDIKSIFLAVGTSLLASSLFTYFTLQKITKENERIERLDQLGLTTFYLERSDMTAKVSELLKTAEQIDITAIRLKTLLELHEKKLNQLLRESYIKIRIILPLPESEAALIISQLLETSDSILTGLKHVIDWEKKIKMESLKGSLEIRYSEKLVSSMYQRIDNVVFTGPYMRKKDTQETYTLECNASGKIGKVLSEYFTTRFNEAIERPKKKPIIIEFFGMPGAGKSTCIEAIKKIHSDIVSHSNEEIECTPSDTPYEFNYRLLKSLTSIIEDVQHLEILFLDRGLEDVMIWLDFHRKLKNITFDEFLFLKKMVPTVPSNVNYYKLLFLQKPDFTTLRRKVERRIDEWALEELSLSVLFELYESKTSSPVHVIDSTLPLERMQKQVIATIEKIYEEESSIY